MERTKGEVRGLASENVKSRRLSWRRRFDYDIVWRGKEERRK